MDKLLNSITTRINYIYNNTGNKYIDRMIEVIKEKLNPIKNKEVKTQDLLDDICNRIINDVKLLKRVNGETAMVYKKMDELIEFIEQVKVEYFK